MASLTTLRRGATRWKGRNVLSSRLQTAVDRLQQNRWEVTLYRLWCERGVGRETIMEAAAHGIPLGEPPAEDEWGRGLFRDLCRLFAHLPR